MTKDTLLRSWGRDNMILLPTERLIPLLELLDELDPPDTTDHTDEPCTYDSDVLDARCYEGVTRS